MEQRTDEWKKARLGRFTASECFKLMGKIAPTITGLNYFQSETAKTYILQKVAETLTGQTREFSNYATEYGTAYEPEAREYFELATKKTVQQVGFLTADFSEDCGASPDGLIGSDSGIEIKCPFNNENHVLHMMIGNDEDLKRIKPEYYWQIQMSMLVTGATSWNFVSYNPCFMGKFRMHIVEIKRSEQDIEELKSRLLKAVEIKNNILKQLS